MMFDNPKIPEQPGHVPEFDPKPRENPTVPPHAPEIVPRQPYPLDPPTPHEPGIEPIPPPLIEPARDPGM